MLKIPKMMLFTIASILLLAACGQGGADSVNSDPEENEEVVPENNNEVSGDTEEASHSEPAEENIVEPTEDEAQLTTVSLYFSDDELMETYRVEKEIEIASEEESAKAALEAWIHGPEQDGL